MNWSEQHARRAVEERDKAFERCEDLDAKFGRDHPKTLDAWMKYFRAEDVARDVCAATSSKSLLAIAETDEPPKGLSDKTKGIVVGAAGALALVGIVYAIVQEEKPKAKPKHAKPVHVSTEGMPLGPPDKVPVYFPDGSYGYASFEEARQLGATTDGSGWDRRENFRLYGPKTEEAELEVVETQDEDGRIKITTILKDVSTVGMAARGLAALEPIAEMLIALL
jgi:hypothetical protein